MPAPSWRCVEAIPGMHRKRLTKSQAPYQTHSPRSTRRRLIYHGMFAFLWVYDASDSFLNASSICHRPSGIRYSALFDRENCFRNTSILNIRRHHDRETDCTLEKTLCSVRFITIVNIYSGADIGSENTTPFNAVEEL